MWINGYGKIASTCKGGYDTNYIEKRNKFDIPKNINSHIIISLLNICKVSQDSYMVDL